jgi:hypothetical protein
MDVDDEADLRALAQEDLRDTETGQWFERSGLLQRLMQFQLQPPARQSTRGNTMKLAANL